jgi:hypothetical protein
MPWSYDSEKVPSDHAKSRPFWRFPPFSASNWHIHRFLICFLTRPHKFPFFVRHQNHVNEDDTLPEGRGPPDEAQARFPDACIICDCWLIFGETIEYLYHRIYLQQSRISSSCKELLEKPVLLSYSLNTSVSILISFCCSAAGSIENGGMNR